MDKPFDLLAEYAKFGAQQKVSLRDPKTAPAFVAYVREAVERALGDPALVHGHRAEAMFEAMLLSLGEYALLKPEDVGRVHPNEIYQVPDFRVVLKDGRQWLIEVKNVYIDEPGDQERQIMTRAYWEKLEAYAAATGGELKLAVFWARWAMWSLITPSKLIDANGNLSLNMLTSMKANELGELGDRTIGTRFPLRFRVLADQEKPSAMTPDGIAQFTIGGVQMFCGDEEILDPTEREIAWIFMQHGQWEELGPEAELLGGRLTAVEYRWEPINRQNEGFEIIGTLSRMFTRYYAEQTVDAREVVQVHAPLRPGWFEPLVSPDFESDALPLWTFILQANYGDAQGE